MDMRIPLVLRHLFGIQDPVPRKVMRGYGYCSIVSSMIELSDSTFFFNNSNSSANPFICIISSVYSTGVKKTQLGKLKMNFFSQFFQPFTAKRRFELSNRS